MRGSEKKWSKIEATELAVTCKNVVEIRVREINENDVLLEIRSGEEPPELYRMTLEDNWIGHLRVNA